MVETYDDRQRHTSTTDNYYLFYAGSDEGASTYAIGWASCPSGPAAACTDMSTAGPCSPRPRACPGPAAPTSTTSPWAILGDLVMAFAAWQGTTIGYLDCGIRPMYLADSAFSVNGAARPPWRPPTTPGPRPAQLPTAAASAGPGYWQVGSDGGIFTFGGAQFYGSTGSLQAQQARGRHGGDTRRQRVLAGGQRRRCVRLRRRRLLRLHRQHHAQQTDHRHDPDHRRRGVLVDRQRRRRVRLRGRKFYGSAGGDNLAYPVTAAAPGSSAAATGSSTPTARSSTTATPAWRDSPPTLRAGTASPAWRRRRASTATGWPVPTATWPTSATPRRTAP